jgi:DNA-binding Xre family transcriptional regulator
MSIRISKENLALIHKKATKAKLNFTDYVTRACLGKQIVVIDGLEEIIREQKAIGRNLNQITLFANMGRVDAVNLTALTKRYSELNATLTELLERKRWSDGNG